MSTPNVSERNVALRLELTYEVPGTAEQVWDAVATAHGISSWFLPTDLEERVGGAVVFHMGESESPGIITGFDAPHRITYEEPDWATLTGHDRDSVTPLATEFLVEAQSGGTCVVRVVSSAFGTGADWEQEFFDEMARGWDPWFTNLRLYLTHFPGEHPTVLEVSAEVPGSVAAVWQAARGELGAEKPGARVDVRGYACTVERVDEDPPAVVLHVRAPVPGLLVGFVHMVDDDRANLIVSGRFFGPDAAGFVEREAPGWQAWVDGIVVDA